MSKLAKRKLSVAPEAKKEGDYPSKLHQMISTLKWGFSDYPSALSSVELETLSITIFEVMSGRWRKYHTVDHIYSISQGASPIQTLAILFHDTIYVQVDGSIDPKLGTVLPEFQFVDYSSIMLPLINSQSSDSSLYVVAEVFGFKSEQSLTPFTGSNEFLSALAAYRILEKKLSQWDLLRLAACIEQTIAFRGKNDQGEDSIELLERNVRRVCKFLGITKSDSDFRKLIAEAVDVANRDLMSFSYADPGKFLNQTWELILEGNPVFKSPTHSIKQYRIALTKVEKFFVTVDPETIYYHVPGLPISEQEIANQVKRAKTNLAIATEYIDSKILTVAILEAIANLTGGDVPIVLFMGEIRQASDDLASLRIEKILDQSLKAHPEEASNPQVLSLLTNGLNESADFDLKNSFLSSYLYPRLSPQERKQHLHQANDMFEGRLSYLEFLNGFKKDIRDTILEALGKIAWPREVQIRDLMKRLST